MPPSQRQMGLPGNVAFNLNYWLLFDIVIAGLPSLTECCSKVYSGILLQYKKRPFENYYCSIMGVAFMPFVQPT